MVWCKGYREIAGFRNPKGGEAYGDEDHRPSLVASALGKVELILVALFSMFLALALVEIILAFTSSR